ncbi:hypothetical protein FJT64_007130 [Amphibalanus amphitrite]|uniref:Uncharacterized protein n=1 Tax=Amphibalanus amphitrite TaxID=1232801 RepID=A0A6A4W0M0_AMPAM|nr:hypothetical protein FJT64_007130 [Amphibalanus amphitrite]
MVPHPDSPAEPGESADDPPPPSETQRQDTDHETVDEELAPATRSTSDPAGGPSPTPIVPHPDSPAEPGESADDPPPPSETQRRDTDHETVDEELAPATRSTSDPAGGPSPTPMVPHPDSPAEPGESADDPPPPSETQRRDTDPETVDEELA